MSFSDCLFRDTCQLRRDFLKSRDETRINKIRELENKIELHEAYVSEMRTELQKRIIKLIERNPIAATI